MELKVHILTLVFFGQTKYNIYHYVGGAIMDYITTKEAAAKWGISDRRILQYCNDNRIEGAAKMGNTWLIPKNAKKPADGRIKKRGAVNGTNCNM